MRQKRPKNGTSAISCMMTVTCKLFGRMFFFFKNLARKPSIEGCCVILGRNKCYHNIVYVFRISFELKIIIKKHIKRSIWPFVYLKRSCNFDNVFVERFEAIQEPNGIETIECFKQSFACDNLCLCYPNGSADSLKYTRLGLFDLE